MGSAMLCLLLHQSRSHHRSWCVQSHCNLGPKKKYRVASSKCRSFGSLIFGDMSFYPNPHQVSVPCVSASACTKCNIMWHSFLEANLRVYTRNTSMSYPICIPPRLFPTCLLILLPSNRCICYKRSTSRSKAEQMVLRIGPRLLMFGFFVKVWL